jgi:hypothetical protein
VKQHGRANDLIARLRADPAFAVVKWERVLDPRAYVGLAPQQARGFLRDVVRPALRRARAGRVAPVAPRV